MKFLLWNLVVALGLAFSLNAKACDYDYCYDGIDQSYVSFMGGANQLLGSYNNGWYGGNCGSYYGGCYSPYSTGYYNQQYITIDYTLTMTYTPNYYNYGCGMPTTCYSCGFPNTPTYPTWNTFPSYPTIPPTRWDYPRIPVNPVPIPPVVPPYNPQPPTTPNGTVTQSTTVTGQPINRYTPTRDMGFSPIIHTGSF